MTRSSVGPKIAVTGTPTAAARCIAPESFDTNARHRASTPASSRRSVRPIRFTGRTSGGQRRFYLTARVAIAAGADEHAHGAPLARHARDHLGDAARRPALGVPVRGARREADERRGAGDAVAGEQRAGALGRVGRARRRAAATPARRARGRARARGSTSDWWRSRPSAAPPRGSAASRGDSRRSPIAPGSRPCRAIQAARNEFGNSSAASNFPSASMPPASRRSVASRRRAQSARPGRRRVFLEERRDRRHRRDGERARPGNAARTAAIAGSAITASPSQFGARTTRRRAGLAVRSSPLGGSIERRRPGASSRGRGREHAADASRRRARRASGGASTATAPDSGARTSRARRCSAA